LLESYSFLQPKIPKYFEKKSCLQFKDNFCDNFLHFDGNFGENLCSNGGDKCQDLICNPVESLSPSHSLTCTTIPIFGSDMTPSNEKRNKKNEKNNYFKNKKILTKFLSKNNNFPRFISSDSYNQSVLNYALTLRYDIYSPSIFFSITNTARRVNLKKENNNHFFSKKNEQNVDGIIVEIPSNSSNFSNNLSQPPQNNPTSAKTIPHGNIFMSFSDPIITVLNTHILTPMSLGKLSKNQIFTKITPKNPYINMIQPNFVHTFGTMLILHPYHFLRPEPTSGFRYFKMTLSFLQYTLPTNMKQLIKSIITDECHRGGDAKHDESQHIGDEYHHFEAKYDKFHQTEPKYDEINTNYGIGKYEGSDGSDKKVMSSPKCWGNNFEKDFGEFFGGEFFKGVSPSEILAKVFTKYFSIIFKNDPYVVSARVIMLLLHHYWMIHNLWHGELAINRGLMEEMKRNNGRSNFAGQNEKNEKKNNEKKVLPNNNKFLHPKETGHLYENLNITEYLSGQAQVITTENLANFGKENQKGLYNSSQPTPTRGIITLFSPSNDSLHSYQEFLLLEKTYSFIKEQYTQTRGNISTQISNYNNNIEKLQEILINPTKNLNNFKYQNVSPNFSSPDQIRQQLANFHL